VRGHDGVQAGLQPAVGGGVGHQDGFEAALIHGNLVVRIGCHIAVARKVLAAVAHARLQQAVHERLSQHADHARIGAQGAVADHGAAAVVEVQHRGEAQIDAAGTQFGRQHVAASGGGAAGGERGGAGWLRRLTQPHLPQRAHGRQVRKAVAAKALHAAAFVIDADQQVGAYFFDLPAQLGELGAALPVAAKQNHTAHQRVCEALALGFVEPGAGDVDDQGGVLHGFCSTTTKLVA